MSFDRPATKPPQVPALASPTAKLPSPKNRLTPPGPVSTQQSPSSRPASEPSKREKVEGIYKQLSHAAVDLNGASDELGKPIQVWEAALKKLNLGVSAWVELSSGGDDRERWWDRGVGYTKLKDRWGIALRTREGSHQSPDDDSEAYVGASMRLGCPAPSEWNPAGLSTWRDRCR